MMHEIIPVIAGLVFFGSCALLIQMVVAPRGKDAPQPTAPRIHRSAVTQRSKTPSCSRCAAPAEVSDDLWVRYGVCRDCYRVHVVQRPSARSNYHFSSGDPMRVRMLDESRRDCAEGAGRGGDDHSGCWDNAVRAYEDR